MSPGEQYHIFNHANGFENIFIEEKNYYFFLRKLEQHVLPVCKIYAYCLMPNHFHILVEPRSEEYLTILWKKQGDSTILSPIVMGHKISKAFANFFSSYTQAFNKVYNRKGSLFIPSMKNTIIEDELSFCKVVHYIHSNPVHHGFANNMYEWEYSSYKTMMSNGNTKIERKYVLEMFGGIAAFKEYHKHPIDVKSHHIVKGRP